MPSLSLPLSLPLLILLTFTLCSPTPALGQSPPSTADFDTIAQGPYLVPLLSGSPDYMSVLDATNAVTLYPNLLPPGASGRVLRVDNSTQGTDVILRFPYDCAPGDGVSGCRISYSYVGWSMVEGKGIQVHIDDDGTYATPDFAWAGVIPEGDWQVSTLGSGSHDAIGCSATHTLDIVVEGGALLLLDRVLSECLSTVPTEKQSFGTLKSRFD